ncbi:TorF family putative porin [Thalassolituus sp. LLYu03]|uniref:TorF family putative porin n=1 Tax=Thalassolituus sp. LLYu03 TaxID=3421656 RepID=UPI003D2BB7E3
MKKFAFLAAPALLTLAVSAAAAPAYNAGLVTDYLFRGLTQTDHGVALQGGADIKNGNAYGGVWFSNVETPDGSEGLPVEMDVYFGYNNQFSKFNLDMEVLTYNYLNDSIGDETEFKIGSTLAKGLDVNLYRGVKGKTWFPEVTYEMFLPERLYLDVSAGLWIQDDADDEGLTARAELGRDFPELHGIDLYVGASYISDDTPFGDNNDQDDSDLRFFAGVRKNF